MQESRIAKEKSPKRWLLETMRVGQVLMFRTKKSTYLLRCEQRAERGKFLEFRILNPSYMAQQFPDFVSIAGDFIQAGKSVLVVDANTREQLFATSGVTEARIQNQ
jgi:hypothetical protein